MRYVSPYAKDRSNDDRSEWSTGSRLERWLHDHGVSKEELIRRSGVSKSTVYRICGGDSIGTLSTWQQIADALGCSVSDIIDGEGK